MNKLKFLIRLLTERVPEHGLRQNCNEPNIFGRVVHQAPPMWRPWVHFKVTFPVTELPVENEEDQTIDCPREHSAQEDLQRLF